MPPMHFQEQVESYIQVGSDEATEPFNAFCEAWSRYVQQTPNVKRFAAAKTSDLRRYGESIKSGSEHKWKLRNQKSQRLSHIQGQRWCGRDQWNEPWKPILEVDEVPYFFWNLALGRLSQHPPTSFEDFEQLVKEKCHYFAREDVRTLKRLFQQNSNSASASTSADQVSKSAESISTQYCASEASKCFSFEGGGEALKRLEYNIRDTYAGHLSNFKRQIQQRHRQDPMISIFERNIQKMLTLIGTEEPWPWGSFATECGSSFDCDYISTTSQELEAFVAKGATMRAVPHVIRNAISLVPSSDINREFIRGLDLRLDGATIEVQDQGQPLLQNIHITAAELQQRYDNVVRDTDFACAPTNLLDLRDSNPCRATCLTSQIRFQGIDLAHKWCHETGQLGKSSFKPCQAQHQSYTKACASFELLGLRGSYSGPHVDFLGHTQLTCLSGLKAWFVHTLSEDSSDKEEFCQKGDSWAPVGKFKLILLRPGDHLILPPGGTIVHAPITIENCLMAGGMYIDLQQLPWLGRHIVFEIENDCVTNEFLPGDFREIWESLVSKVTRQPSDFGIDHSQEDWFLQELRTADASLRAHLSCICKNCDDSCVCRSRSLSGRHCSIWCHGKKSTRRCCQPR